MLGALGVTCGGARAQADGRVPESTGVEIGVRGGYGVPFGQRAAGAALSGPVEGAASPMIDLGYRFTPQLYLGVLFAYGILVLDEAAACREVVVDSPAGRDCRGNAALLALDAQYRTRMGERFASWVDFAVGLESLGMVTPSGWSSYGGFASRVEFGAGWFAPPRFTIGPFASLSVGQFRTSEFSLDGDGTPSAIADKGIHGWLSVGFRMMLTLR